MAEFASISNFLREKCEDNSKLQKYCLTTAAKYIDFAKKELRAQNAREENIMLKLDIGNLQSIYQTVTENNEAQVELDKLLMEYYDEHIKSAFDIDECELEKLASYDEIKLELETRDSINMYQRLYERKIKIAKKMEERNIVKQYRQVEEEYSKIKTERVDLEERVDKLQKKAKEYRARREEESKLILQLVQGSVELESLFANQCPHKLQSQLRLSGNQCLSGITFPQINEQKVGLSSRLLVNFKQFKMPAIPPVRRIREISQRNGLNRLLQQSEVIRKSMETSPIVLSGEFASPKLTGILKIPNEHSKPAEVLPKTVSFDVNSLKDVRRRTKTQEEVTPKTTGDTLDPSYSETIEDSEMEESIVEKHSKKSKIEITENIVIKPADIISKDILEGVQPRTTNKRKADKQDFQNQEQSPPKMKCTSPETSINIGSKSFMEMFMDLSKDTPTSEVFSPEFEPIKNPKKQVKPKSEIENVKEINEKKPMEQKTNDIKQTKDIKPKTKAPIKQFDGFEEFLSQFAGNTSDTKDNDEEDAGDMSFDFFRCNDDTEQNGNEDAAGVDMSFEF